MNNYSVSIFLAVVNIGLIQLRQYDRLSATLRDDLILEHFKRLFHKASHKYGSEIDLVCLPELWYTKIVRDFEREFKVILDVAREYDFTVIPGAFKEKISNDTYVSCPVVTPNGSVLGRQFKIHLFGLQRRTFKPGSKMELFDIGKLKFSVAICYDLVFPEIARSAVREGADLLFFPSKIPKKGINPWHLYLQVRALENRIPVVASNVCGGLFGGRSMIVDLTYDKNTDIAIPKIKTGASVKEQIIIVDIDLKRSRQIRKRRFADSFRIS
ncbi:MAG: carbon-nitrogen hydrolase family protein [Nitrososphaeraceae archaeon]